MVGSANAAIREEPVTYTDGQTTMKGFVVYDDAIDAKRPGIVMVHEWWGITRHIHNEARNFAQQGYTVLISDMFGDAKTADNPKDAGALSASVMKNPAVMESRFNAARDELAKQNSVDPKRIGAIGYCFGGAVRVEHGACRSRPRHRDRLSRITRSQYSGAGTGNRQSENSHPERRGR